MKFLLYKHLLYIYITIGLICFLLSNILAWNCKITILPQYVDFAKIPVEICNTELEKLVIYSNILTRTIPLVIFNMSSLKILYLFENDFSGGMLPYNMCVTLPNLEELYLVNCQLHGSIPAQFTQCRKLRTLALATNNLTGN